MIFYRQWLNQQASVWLALVLHIFSYILSLFVSFPVGQLNALPVIQFLNGTGVRGPAWKKQCPFQEFGDVERSDGQSTGWVQCFDFFQYIDTGGWVTTWASSHFSPRVIFHSKWLKKPRWTNERRFPWGNCRYNWGGGGGAYVFNFVSDDCLIVANLGRSWGCKLIIIIIIIIYKFLFRHKVVTSEAVWGIIMQQTTNFW